MLKRAFWYMKPVPASGYSLGADSEEQNCWGKGVNNCYGFGYLWTHHTPTSNIRMFLSCCTLASTVFFCFCFLIFAILMGKSRDLLLLKSAFL